MASNDAFREPNIGRKLFSSTLQLSTSPQGGKSPSFSNTSILWAWSSGFSDAWDDIQHIMRENDRAGFYKSVFFVFDTIFTIIAAAGCERIIDFSA